MALVIKALLASECVAKIYICIIVMPIKSMYFLYGWQPKALIRLALWLRQNDLPYAAELEHLKANQLNDLLSTNTYNTSLASYAPVYDRSDGITILNSIEIIKQNYDNDNSSRIFLEEVSKNRLSYEVMAVCSLPNSLDFLGNYSLATFSMVTTIIR